MTKSILKSTLIIFCAAIIESSILSNISFLTVVPDLILICSIYLSLLNGKLYGEINGGISGLILDFITGVPFGFNVLFRTIIGYIFGIFSNNIIISKLVVPVLSVSVGTIIKRLLIIIISFCYPKINFSIYGFVSYNFLFEFIANIVLAPFIFRFLTFFEKSLSIKNTKDMIDNV